MSYKSDNPADPFKKALGEATRALSGNEELEVSYSADPPGRTNTGVRLPQVSRRMTHRSRAVSRSLNRSKVAPSSASMSRTASTSG